VTAILIVTPLIIRLCDSYGFPSRWLLSGSLIASNLGGFSTKWGDTPNIVESRVWGLVTADFTLEVMPANLIVLVVLVLFVVGLTIRTMVKEGGSSRMSAVAIARITSRFNEPVTVNSRLLLIGLVTLGGFILGQAIWPQHQVVVGALTIFAAVVLEHDEDRVSSLKSLGYDVYLTFAAVFVVSGCMEASWVGETLQAVIRDSGPSPWAITTTGYLGTMFSEAASWATAAAERIHPLDNSHTAAWALGGGICAGSSSILTAASAGIILHEESRRFKEGKHAVTFRRYLAFGLASSLFMLAFYTFYFSFFPF
ncbi:MAG TPA: SLC13 family permease, partial [Candidatus Anammoximicrobium sp.]|nr:SLC13 family permease [Candidatus Anammoximicrobium sp.]